MFQILSTLLIGAIFGGATLAAAAPVLFLPGRVAPLIAVVTAPAVFVFAFVLLAGLLARPFVGSIEPGHMKRDVKSASYRNRRLYGLCWTCVYYFTPLYFACLSIGPLKKLLFRLFGYRGDMGFTTYPDTWIRDLPVLEFGAAPIFQIARQLERTSFWATAHCLSGVSESQLEELLGI